MREIDKLRQRLTNVKRGVLEYRMTVIEANELVKEFVEIEMKLQEKSLPAPSIIVKELNTPGIIDGGSF